MLRYSLRQNSALISDVENHFAALDREFTHDLSSRVELNEYVNKICSKAKTIEIWTNHESLERLDALLAYYINGGEKAIFVTYLSVRKESIGLGLARVT